MTSPTERSPMKIDDLPMMPAHAASGVFQQLGQITRQLHETLDQFGFMPRLQHSALGLPEARDRLSYIARKTGEAADKVLTAVELAKHDRARIAAAARQLAQANAADAARPAIQIYVDEVDAAAARIDAHLTDIMVAQDFHDLTGQMVAKIVDLAIELEDGLLHLLVRAAPTEAGVSRTAADASRHGDVAGSQREVDELLASLGF
jgi:chemotaxis protein CheZ